MTSPPTRCRVKACAYLTRRPSGLCPAHDEDVRRRGVADPGQLQLTEES